MQGRGLIFLPTPVENFSLGFWFFSIFLRLPEWAGFLVPAVGCMGSGQYCGGSGHLRAALSGKLSPPEPGRTPVQEDFKPPTGVYTVPDPDGRAAGAMRAGLIDARGARTIHHPFPSISFSIVRFVDECDYNIRFIREISFQHRQNWLQTR